LIENLAGGSQRLDKHCNLGGNGSGHDVEIGLRQSQQLAEGAWMSDNSKNLAARAVPPKAAAAPVAIPAGEIDFADDTPAQQLRIIRRDNLANELVPGSACESVVAAKQFQIGIADATAQQTDRCVPFRRARPACFLQRHAALFEMDSNH